MSPIRTTSARDETSRAYGRRYASTTNGAVESNTTVTPSVTPSTKNVRSFGVVSGTTSMRKRNGPSSTYTPSSPKRRVATNVDAKRQSPSLFVVVRTLVGDMRSRGVMKSANTSIGTLVSMSSSMET